MERAQYQCAVDTQMIQDLLSVMHVFFWKCYCRLTNPVDIYLAWKCFVFHEWQIYDVYKVWCCLQTESVIRPPDILVGGLIFYHRFYLLFFFLVSYSPISLNRTQPKLDTCSDVSATWKCMSKIWGIPSLYKLRAPKPRSLEDFAT